MISDSDSSRLQATLTATRAGAATLMQLAEAHEIAARNNMTDSLSFIRQQIRAMVPDPNGVTWKKEARQAAVRNVGFGVFIGILAGITTHFILVATGQRHVTSRVPKLPESETQAVSAA